MRNDKFSEVLVYAFVSLTVLTGVGSLSSLAGSLAVWTWASSSLG